MTVEETPEPAHAATHALGRQCRLDLGKRHVPIVAAACAACSTGDANDPFKGINDAHGHAVGDDVIRKFCEVAAKTLRLHDLLGRMGGEEFAVAMPGSGASAAHALAERMSTSETAEHPLAELLECADIALYRAKAAGRNHVERADQPEVQSQPSNVLRIA